MLSSGLTCFTPLEFQRITKATKIGSRKLLERWTKKGLFLRLKNGLYVASDTKPSLWLIANKLYGPSYISLETALSYYGVIPETAYSITSVTSKITRQFEVHGQVFLYRKIKRCAFSGYRPVKIDGQTVLLAEAEKALADYLYFTYYEKSSVNSRVRWNKIKMSLLRKYIGIFSNKNFSRWAKNVIPK